jgi:hypothetical protein
VATWAPRLHPPPMVHDTTKTRIVVTTTVLLKGSRSATVKLLPCDHEIMSSSPENSLLQKCRERLRIEDPKWLDPSPDPTQARTTCIRLPFIAIAAALWCKVMEYLNPYCNYSFFGFTSSSEGMYKVIRPAVGEASRYLILPFSYCFFIFF